MVFVGLDCGGSSSRVLAVGPDGAIVHQGQSGAANLVSTPPARLRKHLGLASEGLSGATHVCGCFAGLVDEPRRRNALELLGELFPRAVLRAEPDYAAALYASPEGTELCLIAGTGSLVCSDEDGRLVKTGGGGYLLGDEGSGFRYGRAAVAAFVRDPSQVGRDVRAGIAQVFRTEEPGEVTAAVYRATSPAALVARLAKPLALDAAAGVPYAIRVVAEESVGVVDIVARHLGRTGHATTARICLAGGLWKSGRVFEEGFRCAWADRFETSPNLVRIGQPPLAGAVRLARALADDLP